MKTIVAETVLFGKEAFETLGQVETVPDRQISARHLADADALMIRSKTVVDENLITASPVRFVGTATAGYEHLDIPLLEQRGIVWAAAPGCNADSVADYLMAALSALFRASSVGLEGKTLGIIGAGQIGSRVARRARALGLNVLLNDPPRAAREGRDGFTDLNDLLAESDFVTLHVPLTDEGPWPTRRMADRSFFEKMKQSPVFINTARGGAVDNDALIHAKKSGRISYTVLDVWDPEPQIRTEVFHTASIGTPHIAGHSLEGKLNGTVQVYREARRVFGKEPAWDPAPLLPPANIPSLHIDSSGRSDLDVITEAVCAVYDIRSDQLSESQVPLFDRLRSEYRIRREFKNTTVHLTENRPALLKKLSQAGFQISPPLI